MIGFGNTMDGTLTKHFQQSHAIKHLIRFDLPCKQSPLQSFAGYGSIACDRKKLNWSTSTAFS